MAAIMDRIRVPEEILVETMVSSLNARTGLEWKGVDKVLSDGTRSIYLSVPSLRLSVDVGKMKDSDVYTVEFVPTRLLSKDYEFWHLVAVLKELGGVRVSRNGEESSIVLPSWAHKRWDELCWLSRRW